MDDSTVTEEVSDPADSHLQKDTDNILQWLDDNHMKINGKKIEEMVISLKTKVPSFIPYLKWGAHVDKIHSKAFQRCYLLTCLKRAGVEENELLDYYRMVIKYIVEYACPAWSAGITKVQSDSLKQIQKCAIYIIAPHLQYKEAITMFNLPTIKDCLDILNSIFFRNIIDNN